MNPMAIVFWAFWACVGYLIAGRIGAVWGLTFALGLSLVIALIED